MLCEVEYYSNTGSNNILFCYPDIYIYIYIVFYLLILVFVGIGQLTKIMREKLTI